ncbi:hypothetical protein OU426_06660 [Frigidibacter sp. RF13]|uniref:hypothetical protein n=1 Tax=Frigidibacter sp. RF13 TaxID=2997340 RepID=UPI002270B7CF|nr:hypothetical protein [Frigidibacter sp. RF13]MCY1126529.1 hypothetical protein [Frigidibacter sp. RF13]
MKRQMISLAAAAALALSGMAAPARAEDKDVLKLLLGAAAVGLLINQVNKNKNKTDRVTRNPYPYVGDDWTYQGDDRNHKKARYIPSECVMDVTVGGRLREVVSARCLKEFGLARKVPAECGFDIRTSVGTRTVYGPQCLRDYGYRIEQARY